jgi:hypothetical protein
MESKKRSMVSKKRLVDSKERSIDAKELQNDPMVDVFGQDRSFRRDRHEDDDVS